IPPASPPGTRTREPLHPPCVTPRDSQYGPVAPSMGQGALGSSLYLPQSIPVGTSASQYGPVAPSASQYRPVPPSTDQGSLTSPLRPTQAIPVWTSAPQYGPLPPSIP
ncbi:hypothetical protein N328_08044, partial [Gavia stellata]